MPKRTFFVKKETQKKGTTLHRRLLLFFVSAFIVLIISFALLLAIFGITGTEEKSIRGYIDTQLNSTADAISEDFERITLGGISIAETITLRSDVFFSENKIKANQLSDNPDLIEPLLNLHISTLINSISDHYCGGAFIILDATVAPDAPDAEYAKAGIFLKKTQPTATTYPEVSMYYLRGPAKIARDNEIMLLGQWKMEYNISGQDFFAKTIENAKKNPDMSISRLYYWSERITLKGNSEAGFLLCIPLRSQDGTVFGICGIEVSDRMFKSLYTPTNSDFDNIFILMSQKQNNTLLSSKGLVAGNYYLTGKRYYEDMSIDSSDDNFESFSYSGGSFGGRCCEIELYPASSPYINEKWTVSLLIPTAQLNKALSGDIGYFVMIIIGLIIISFILAYFISRRYLRPVTQAFHSIKHLHHRERAVAAYTEINDLFDFLAEKDTEYEKLIEQKEQETRQMSEEYQKTHSEYQKAQLEISRLAYSRKTEVDPDLYEQFLLHHKTLTPTEREIFDLYISGKHAKEILDIMNIKENTLKFHNKNIYSKLGVSSRKELLRYATIMNQEQQQTT